ncbi:MAG: hypothetical protein JJU02_12455 [Cryomorphaceae bacterium]|nr:hypothetical protein [Cryomorphaceae bacterium]
MISIKIEGIFEPEQVRIQKSIDKEDFGRKELFRADSKHVYQIFQKYMVVKIGFWLNISVCDLKIRRAGLLQQSGSFF